MKRTETETEQQPKRGLWYSVLAVIAPCFALVLAVAFVLFAYAFGGVRRRITIELGEVSPEAAAFLRQESGDAEYVFAPEACYRAAGDYPLRVCTDGRTVPVVLRVTDTQPPRANGIETTVPVKCALTPDKLIRNLKDRSTVKVTYETEPDFDTIGDYEAVVLLEDASGNRSRVTSLVHVRAVRDEIVLEAGSETPAAETFLIGTYGEVEMTPVTESMMRTPGEYPIRFLLDGIETESRLVVRDTIPPAGRGTTCIIAPGEPVRPDMLVTDVADETEVTAAFVAEPDPDSLDAQTIGIALTDLGGNETTVYATLVFSNVKPVEVEARTSPLTIEELLNEGTFAEAALETEFVPDEPGQHVLAVTIDGKQNLALVNVCDTTPPEIKVIRTKWYLNAPVDPGTFVKATDATATTFAYLSDPDWTAESQEVTVAAIDASGNRTEKNFTLKLSQDVEPPMLYGVLDRIFYIGEPVAYFAEVSAWDDCDGDVEVTVDSSAVNADRWGTYPVTYSATDKAGNTASKTVQYRFIIASSTDARAQEVADKYIARILTDGMTLAEQIEAIYDYVFTHVRYSAVSNKMDWRSEAIRGLTTGRGDCFTAYAAARLLLERTDAKIVSVQRLSTNSHHYWMLVNIGTGWYHFDACRAWTGKHRCFMWTDAQTHRYSKVYWRYDKTLYPPVATEPYNGGN